MYGAKIKRSLITAMSLTFILLFLFILPACFGKRDKPYVKSDSASYTTSYAYISVEVVNPTDLTYDVYVGVTLTYQKGATAGVDDSQYKAEMVTIAPKQSATVEIQFTFVTESVRHAKYSVSLDSVRNTNVTP